MCKMWRLIGNEKKKAIVLKPKEMVNKHVQHIVGTLAVLGHLIPIIDVMKKVILHANALILAKLISGIMNHQPKKKVQKKRKEQKEFISKPHDFGRAWKKKGKNEGGYKSGCKVKQNGGWISDDPEDYPQLINWRSPSTPRNKRAKISNFSTGASYGLDNYHHYHGFSASRFDNISHNRWRNNAEAIVIFSNSIISIREFPLIIRLAFTLGGTGGGIAYNREEFEAICKSGLADSLISQVLVEKSLLDWKEYELNGKLREILKLKLMFSVSSSLLENCSRVSPPRSPQFLPISLGVYSQYKGVTEEPSSDEYDEDFYVDNTPPHC
ncbi:hypothetical protein T459_09217 [Capsicum annuum]|uniref:Carbamoyl phosphate synthase ATP-binding domain-containing protein n=1 Tax=Capsicum annuum TaxID=4072 RepID=A0A2G2ZYT5_CAPAN|nr:hypothetical protein T459_09217 [Capsicum annuum]